AVDAAGNPVLDANGNGVLARDAAGNLVPSADLSKGAETAPIGLGLDGLRGTADDNVGIVLTSNGLERADAATGTPVQGRDISLATLHDGQVVVTYIGTDEHVHLRIFVPDTNQTADRDTSAITLPGLITYKELALPAGFPTDLGEVRSGQTQHVVAQQNGSFGVFWGANDTSGTPGVITNAAAVQGMIFSGAGTNWSPSPLLTLETGLAPSVNFQVASSGVDPIGIENGFVLTWEQPNGTLAAQRFDMKGAAVGKLAGVDDPATGPHTGLSAVGIDDDRILLGYQNGADIIAQYLDTREPGASIIGPRTGAPRDVAVGTVGGDSMDGRALADQLYGGLGNDLITLGSGADIGVGGLGNDTIIGGPGQDQLLGEDGDDLLAGGFSGPADPKVDRDLQTGLAAAGISPAVIAGELGADIVSGGAGKDTITFQSEVGRFDINLATGMVMSDRGATGTFALEDVIGAIVDDGAGGTIFRFTKDVENAVGGEGDDMLTGDAGDNVLDGGPGNNTIDGGGGNDTVVLHGKFADNTVNFTAASNTFTIAGASSTDTIVNVENFRFDDVTKTLAQLTSGTTGPDSAAPTDIVFNGDTKAVSVSLAENSAAGVVVTTLATIDPDTAAGLATDRFTYTLDQTTAFQIVGNKIVVKDPAPLDFEATKTFALKVTTRDTAGPANSFSKPLTVNLTNVNEAPTTVTFTPAAFAESAANGTSVGTLSATDPDAGDTARFQLADDAGGRFMIVGNTLQIAENLLLDHRGDDTNQTYTVQVRAIDAGSLSSKVQPFSVTATGATENRVIGTAADNAALNGTAGADYIDGGAGRDTMTGGAGNDSYVVDNTSDKVVENAGGGTDTIYTRLASFDLGSAANVENMVFIGTGAFNGRLNNVGGTLIGGAAGDQLQGGTGNDVLKGLAGNDVISANNGSDTLIGGAGNDTMTGGTGADVFAFLGGSGTDTITDFGATAGANQDILQLSTSIAKDFASLQASGAISQSGQNGVINLGGSDTVTLQKIALNAIDASDFRFV
ncbi:MAG TPA: hypothetical protein VFL55_03760, partial [Acetobacteraceae bacterium]|nr:hypothetical protein [Acetobacteraceae bacterium]